MMKGGWRILHHQIDADLPKCVQIITACCVLHNMNIREALEEKNAAARQAGIPAVALADPYPELLNLQNKTAKRLFIAQSLR